jgi:YVTN family beta-propeller protein
MLVIDGATNQKIAKIPLVGTSTYALCWNSVNNKVYATSGVENKVTVVDGVTNQRITTIPVGADPEALVYNPTDNKVYCGNTTSGSISVINGATNAVIATITTGGSPYLAYNPTNNKIYCANGNNTTSVINCATNTVSATLPIISYAFQHNPINNKVYCSSDGNNVRVLNGTTNAVVATIPVEQEPSAMIHNPVQNRVYVTNYWASSISVLRDAMGIEDSIGNWKLEIENSKFNVYPNPARSWFSIHLPQTAGRAALKMYDVSGKLVKELESFGDRELRVSLKDIKPGVYILQYGTETTKLVVR